MEEKKICQVLNNVEVLVKAFLRPHFVLNFFTLFFFYHAARF